MKQPTFFANIYCGLKQGYEGEINPLLFAERIVQGYCDRVKIGVTVTPTIFIYPGGKEPGIIVGLINYPRFPSTPEEIRHHAVALAHLLKQELQQERLSVVCPDETLLIGNP